MNYYDIIWGPAGLLNYYLLQPVSKLLPLGVSYRPANRRLAEHENSTPKSHFGGWPNLGAVSSAPPMHERLTDRNSLTRF
jgi:hypothetical protein